MYNIGDEVVITDSFHQFSNYSDWVEEYAPDYLYVYNNFNHMLEGDMGEIIAIAQGCYLDEDFYLVSNIDGVALMSEEGIELTASDSNCKMFNVGDRVRITNEGKTYPNYKEWMKLNAPEYLEAYEFSPRLIEGDTGEVVVVARHEQFNEYIYLISNGHMVAMVSSEGLELTGEFSKSGLRTGMVVKHRNGVKSIVLVDAIRSEETLMAELLLVSRDYCVVDIEVYDDKLSHKRYNQHDIVEVRRFDHASDMFKKYDLENDYEELELIWAREKSTQYIIGSIPNSDEILMWESNDLGLDRGDTIEVIDNGKAKMVRVKAIISSEEIKPSSQIIRKMGLVWE